MLRRENVVIHTHGHTIIIYCYLQRCITTVRIITTILPRECRTGKRADLDCFHRGSKILDTVWISLLERSVKNRWTASNCINCYQSARDSTPIFFFQFFRKCAYCDIKWMRAFVLRNRTSVIHVSEQSRLSFKCDSDCWSIPEDEEKQNGILSITRELTAIVWIYEV